MAARVFVALLLSGYFSSSRADDSRWLDVPFVAQSGEGCGAASIAMVMQYWIRQDMRIQPSAADGDRIYKLLSSSGKGISGQALKRYLEAQGFDVFVFDGELRDLRQHFEKGRPVVVCFAPNGSRGPLHYSVVVGIADGAVLLNDPARGKLVREDLPRFERAWKATRNWALLAVPRQAR